MLEYNYSNTESPKVISTVACQLKTTNPYNASNYQHSGNEESQLYWKTADQ